MLMMCENVRIVRNFNYIFPLAKDSLKFIVLFTTFKSSERSGERTPSSKVSNLCYCLFVLIFLGWEWVPRRYAKKNYTF